MNTGMACRGTQIGATVLLVIVAVFGSSLGNHGVQAQPAAADVLRIDGFDKTYPAGQVAPNWESTKFAPIFGSGETFFFQFVHNGPEEHFLHVKTGRNNSFSLAYTKPVELKNWHWIEWDWKMAVLPKGGDVRVKERDDQAGALCLIIDPHLTSFDSTLCYIFENDGPKDTSITSTHSNSARYLILRTKNSGDPVGEWLHERRNLYEDYKRVFGKEPGRPAYLGVQIDSNDTQSSAEAFYRNIVLRKS